MIHAILWWYLYRIIMPKRVAQFQVGTHETRIAWKEECNGPERGEP